MQNAIYQITKLQKPFTYFHTHVLDRKVMNDALQSSKSVEIDVSIDSRGSIYVGHPLTYYSSRNLPPPSNLPLETIISESKPANLFLIFDCKNVRVLPRVQEAIQNYGTERSLLHAFVKELSIEPWPPKVVAQSEASWPDEELPLAEVLKIKQATGAPLVLSCHGITLERLAAEEQTILDKILKIAKDKAEVVNLFLPHDEILPLAFANKLLENGILPLVNVDHIPLESRPKVYMGTTDLLSSATNPRDLQ